MPDTQPPLTVENSALGKMSRPYPPPTLQKNIKGKEEKRENFHNWFAISDHVASTSMQIKHRSSADEQTDCLRLVCSIIKVRLAPHSELLDREMGSGDQKSIK